MTQNKKVLQLISISVVLLSLTSPAFARFDNMGTGSYSGSIEKKEEVNTKERTPVQKDMNAGLSTSNSTKDKKITNNKKKGEGRDSKVSRVNNNVSNQQKIEKGANTGAKEDNKVIKDKKSKQSIKEKLAEAYESAKERVASAVDSIQEKLSKKGDNKESEESNNKKGGVIQDIKERAAVLSVNFKRIKIKVLGHKVENVKSQPSSNQVQANQGVNNSVSSYDKAHFHILSIKTKDSGVRSQRPNGLATISLRTRSTSHTRGGSNGEDIHGYTGEYNGVTDWNTQQRNRCLFSKDQYDEKNCSRTYLANESVSNIPTAVSDIIIMPGITTLTGPTASKVLDTNGISFQNHAYRYQQNAIRISSAFCDNKTVKELTKTWHKGEASYSWEDATVEQIGDTKRYSVSTNMGSMIIECDKHNSKFNIEPVDFKTRYTVNMKASGEIVNNKVVNPNEIFYSSKLYSKAKTYPDGEPVYHVVHGKYTEAYYENDMFIIVPGDAYKSGENHYLHNDQNDINKYTITKILNALINNRPKNSYDSETVVNSNNSYDSEIVVNPNNSYDSETVVNPKNSYDSETVVNPNNSTTSLSSKEVCDIPDGLGIFTNNNLYVARVKRITSSKCSYILVRVTNSTNDRKSATVNGSVPYDVAFKPSSSDHYDYLIVNAEHGAVTVYPINVKDKK